MDLKNLFGNLKTDESNDPLHLNSGKLPETKPEEPIIGTTIVDADEVKTLQEHMAKIEKDYDGISNIPHGHIYYDLRNRIQQLTQK